MKYLFFLLITLSATVTSQAQNNLRTDGYYYSFDNAKNDSSWHYLRFYKDGTVIEVNSVARPGKLMKAFKKDTNPNIFQGSYTLNGKDMQFTVADKMKQKIAYKGTIEGNKIKLHLHSFVNGFESDELYSFVPITGLE